MAPNRSRHWPALPQGQPCVPFRWLRALWEVPGLVAESSGLRPSGEGVPCSWAGAGASLCPVSAATAPCRHICAPLLCGTRAPAAQLADSVGCPSWAWRLCRSAPLPPPDSAARRPSPPITSTGSGICSSPEALPASGGRGLGTAHGGQPGGAGAPAASRGQWPVPRSWAAL